MGTVSARLSQVALGHASVVGSRSYLPLWLAQLVSSFGDSLHYIAMVVLVFQLTGQGLAVAGVAAAEILPVLLLAPVAGVIIDRFNRKWVLICADLFGRPWCCPGLATGGLACLSGGSFDRSREHLLQLNSPGGYACPNHARPTLSSQFRQLVGRSAGPDHRVRGGWWINCLPWDWPSFHAE